MIPVQDKLAARTPIYSVGQREFLSVSAPRTILGCVGRVDLYRRASSVFSFGEQQEKEHCPGRVRNRFCEAVIVDHAVDFKVFDRDETESVDDFASRLMNKISPTESDSLVNTGNGFSTFGALRSAIGFLAQFALYLGQFLFVRAKEFWVVNDISCGKRGESRQPNVDADAIGRGRQRCWCLDFTGERCVPFPSRRTADSAGLRFSFQRTVQDNLHATDLGKPKTFTYQLAAGRNLWEGHAVVAMLAAKARKARFFSSLATSKERLESQVDTNGDVLQNLRMNVGQEWAFCLENWQAGMLFVQGRPFASLFVDGLAFFKKLIVEPTAFVQRCFKNSLLLWCGEQAIFKTFTHDFILA